MSDDLSIEDLTETATEQFAVLESLDDPEAEALLNENDHTFQFNVDGGRSFCVDVRGGDVSVTVGTSDRDDEEVTTITGNAETLHAIFVGETTIVDEVWESNVQAQVYGVGMEDTSWVSRMLKRIRHEQGKFIPRGQHTYGPYDR
jgi:hypothetical protein